MGSWPAITFETLPWQRDRDDLMLTSKTRRRRIRSTYEAAIPASIGSLAYQPPIDLAARLDRLALELVRFDERQRELGFDLPALLLRSESSASSHIENLTSSVRNVALAQLTATAPHNAEYIARNIAAMRKALAVPVPLDLPSIAAVHDILMGHDPEAGDSGFRTEQVWIGGTNLSPHGATFVPPSHERIVPALEDLLGFIEHSPTSPIALVAIAHAQFETIHPFTDGNGRTGRALMHTMLRQCEVLSHATLPLSAGLLASVSEYHAALDAYREGNPQPIVEQVAKAHELALDVGDHLAASIRELLDRWDAAITERAGSSIWRVATLLVQQPVVDVAYVARHLDITDRAALDVLKRATDYGFVQPMGNARRGVFYQADEIIDLLEVAAGERRLRRSPS